MPKAGRKISQKTPRPEKEMKRGWKSVKKTESTSAGVFYIVHQVARFGVKLPVLPTLHSWGQHKRGLAHVEAKLEKETLMMGTMIIEDQTGIQASPIQHLTTIFLGSSYRKSTWTIDPLIQVLFELNSHHILLHSSLHIVEVLHLLWLVIIPQRATTPSPYLRVQ